MLEYPGQGKRRDGEDPMKALRGAVFSACMTLALSPGAFAAEGGSGVYLLGFRGLQIPANCIEMPIPEQLTSWL